MADSLKNVWMMLMGTCAREFSFSRKLVSRKDLVSRGSFNLIFI